MLEALAQLGGFGWTNILTMLVVFLLLIAEADKLFESVCSILNKLGIQISTKQQRRDKAQEEEIQHLKEELESYQHDTEDRENEWHRQSIDIRNNLSDSQKKLASTQKHQEDVMIRVLESIESLNKQLLDEKIERMRWRILDFSSSLANGNSAGIEQFNNVINVHTEYEKVLEQNGMTNGLVDASFAFIQQKYQELLSHRDD